MFLLALKADTTINLCLFKAGHKLCRGSIDLLQSSVKDRRVQNAATCILSLNTQQST